MISAAKASFMVGKKRQINPYLLLILAFLGFVFIGSFLLSMPFAFRNNPNNEWCHVGSYLDAFFTSLAAMTLTGITSYPEGLANTLSLAGQIIVFQHLIFSWSNHCLGFSANRGIGHRYFLNLLLCIA